MLVGLGHLHTRYTSQSGSFHHYFQFTSCYLDSPLSNLHVIFLIDGTSGEHGEGNMGWGGEHGVGWGTWGGVRNMGWGEEHGVG